MLTVLLYNYPKVAFLQYCVSVGCGVVSLTKGTSSFPFGDSLGADMYQAGQFRLGEPAVFPQLFDEQSVSVLHKYFSSAVIIYGTCLCC